MSERVQTTIRLRPDLLAALDKMVDEEKRRVAATSPRAAEAVSRSTVLEDLVNAEKHRRAGLLINPKTDGINTPDRR
jgi:hypothetical protein